MKGLSISFSNYQKVGSDTQRVSDSFHILIGMGLGSGSALPPIFFRERSGSRWHGVTPS